MLLENNGDVSWLTYPSKGESQLSVCGVDRLVMADEGGADWLSMKTSLGETVCGFVEVCTAGAGTLIDAKGGIVKSILDTIESSNNGCCGGDGALSMKCSKKSKKSGTKSVAISVSLSLKVHFMEDESVPSDE